MVIVLSLIFIVPVLFTAVALRLGATERRAVPLPEPLGQYCKIRIVGTGTTSGAYFDVTVKGEFYTQ